MKEKKDVANRSHFKTKQKSKNSFLFY